MNKSANHMPSPKLQSCFFPHPIHHGIYWLHESMLGFYRVRYTDGSTVCIPSP